ncbi:hypothetical protein NKH89_34625 [Mesorhizobium sp. M0923]|uniref:hypothetical protein n=1 Tax=Mesorhizobium sp. M0923 TaxID=2957028 RepID=UPI00333683E8
MKLPPTFREMRHPDQPIEPWGLHSACRSAVAATGLSKHVTVHTLRPPIVRQAAHEGRRIKPKFGRATAARDETAIASNSVPYYLHNSG